jgi:S-adenosylmethionine:tRNA ribosyltransferase-isomerase
MRTSDFYYDLPEELIAQHPPLTRDESRLLSVDGNTGELRHMVFRELPALLNPGDCLVINNTKVIPARLIGFREDTGAEVEILLLKRQSIDTWETIVRPGKKVRQGHVIVFIPGKLSGVIEEVLETGNRIVRFTFEGIWEEILDQAGTMPLPPYIHEKLVDRERYQTIYAVDPGSAAAPTAGLHFTSALLDQIRAMGVMVAEVTLHVGLGTFRPVKSGDITEHVMHSEWFSFSSEASDQIRQTKARGGRIIAVGTTSCRTLESIASKDPDMQASEGWTDIFIYPGYKFLCVDALITNFHLPESTLIMLVSAFAGKEHVLSAYQEAIREQYRFFSFGDAMFLTRMDTNPAVGKS